MKKNKRTSTLIYGLVAILLANIAGSYFFFRVDLTSDKRYTLSPVSKDVMRSLDEVAFLRVYLDGEMPIGLKKLRRAVVETLDELSVHAKGKLKYQLVNPSEGSEQKRDAVHRDLLSKGVRSLETMESDGEGGMSQRRLFPGALLSYGGQEKAINFVSNNPSLSEDEEVEVAIQNIEFELVSAISLASRKEKPRIAFIEGHGELNEYQVGDISLELSQYYNVDRVVLGGEVGGLAEYAAVVVAGPTKTWNEADKLVLDQYIMNGGSVAWFLDEVTVYHDSLSRGDWTLATINNHGLSDQLFTYGVRTNPNVVEDVNCTPLPVNIAPPGMAANFQMHPWHYYPLLMPPPTSTITKNVNLVKAQYPSSISLVGKADSLQKTVLLATSQYAKTKNAPFMISLSQTAEKLSEHDFNQSFLPIAVLLEGRFRSVFQNRPLTNYNNGQAFDFIPQGEPAKMVVAADADIIRNDITQRSSGIGVGRMGYDIYIKQLFGNKEFVRNVMLYLSGDDELLSIRKKDFTLRLLNKQKLATQRSTMVTANVLLPILLVAAAAVVFIWLRKRRYAR